MNTKSYFCHNSIHSTLYTTYPVLTNPQCVLTLDTTKLKITLSNVYVFGDTLHFSSSAEISRIVCGLLSPSLSQIYRTQKRKTILFWRSDIFNTLLDSVSKLPILCSIFQCIKYIVTQISRQILVDTPKLSIMVCTYL